VPLLSRKQKIAWMYQYKQLHGEVNYGDSTNLPLFAARFQTLQLMLLNFKLCDLPMHSPLILAMLILQHPVSCGGTSVANIDRSINSIVNSTSLNSTCHHLPHNGRRCDYHRCSCHATWWQLTLKMKTCSVTLEDGQRAMKNVAIRRMASLSLSYS